LSQAAIRPLGRLVGVTSDRAYRLVISLFACGTLVLAAPNSGRADAVTLRGTVAAADPAVVIVRLDSPATLHVSLTIPIRGHVKLTVRRPGSSAATTVLDSRRGDCSASFHVRICSLEGYGKAPAGNYVWTISRVSGDAGRFRLSVRW
jgi:hypothetical protein